jgi:hypothetical protein
VREQKEWPPVKVTIPGPAIQESVNKPPGYYWHPVTKVNRYAKGYRMGWRKRLQLVFKQLFRGSLAQYAPKRGRS